MENVPAKWKTPVCATAKCRETPLGGPPNTVGKFTIPSVLARVVLTVKALELELPPGRTTVPARGGLRRSSAGPEFGVSGRTSDGSGMPWEVVTQNGLVSHDRNLVS